MEQLFIISLSIAVMVSPDTLVLLGNFYGETGIMGGIILFSVIAFYIFLTTQYSSLNVLSVNSDFTVSDKKINPKSSNVLFDAIQMAVKIPVILFLSTGLLVSSGFVFNEVFIFWFPNFGFAFFLLLLILSLQWVNSDFRLYIQLISASVVVFGLLFLSIKGFIVIDFNNLIRESFSNLRSVGIKTIFLPMLLFIGFDLGLNSTSLKKRNQKRSITFAVSLIGIIFILWGWNMTSFLSDQKLIHSSIPHILTAKKIWGETGRYIMGGIVIGGTIASINGLLIYISTQFKNFVQNQNISYKKPLSKYLTTALALSISILMASGLAGSDRLEYLIRSALLLWLVSYSILPLIKDKNRKDVYRKEKTSVHLNLIKKFLVFTIPLIGAVVVIIGDENSFLLLRQMLFQSFGIAILVSIFLLANSRFNQKLK